MGVTAGIYRHFKGEYFYVTQLAKCYDNYNNRNVIYFNICHPLDGMWSRPEWDFVADNDTYDVDDNGVRFAVGTPIKDRKDNKTGQIHRFERVLDLNFQLGSVSTEQLIDELRKREDSPIHELDIEGLQSTIYSKDYVIGIKYPEHADTPAGIDTLNVFFDEQQAQLHFHNYITDKRRKGVFKRVFIECDT